MPYQQLTERDLEVVESVYKYKYLTGSQIQALHFPSETTRNRRIRRLVEHGYLKAFSVLNIPERLFRITSKGSEIVASRHNVLPDELLWKPRTRDPIDPYFMRHHVATNDFRIALVEATQESSVALKGFIPEYYGMKNRSGRITKYIKDVTFDAADSRLSIPHTPDAVFALEKDAKCALFFLEIDRGTETISNPEMGVLKMVRFYLGYLKTGGFKSYTEDFACEPFSSFRTLIVTTSSERIENMRRACTGLPSSVHGALRLLWCSTFDDITPSHVLSPIWMSLHTNDDRLYSLG